MRKAVCRECARCIPVLIGAAAGLQAKSSWQRLDLLPEIRNFLDIVNGTIPAPLTMPQMLVLPHYQNCLGASSVVEDFSIKNSIESKLKIEIQDINLPFSYFN